MTNENSNTKTAETADKADTAEDRQWFIVGRWQSYEGEARANLLRIIGIGAFYIVELVNYYGLQLGSIELEQMIEKSTHQAITLIAAIWVSMSLVILYCLNQRVFPAALKYVSTVFDVILLTAILVVVDGPRSPMVVGYFLLIALSTLRFNLPLVWVSTVGSIVGYGIVGYATWYASCDLSVPAYHSAIFLLALALTGIILGQVIRRVRRLAADYATRLEASKGELS